jgi:threonine/homoserine/homoserine lactone efflux protein
VLPGTTTAGSYKTAGGFGDTVSGMASLVGLIGFAFVSSVTPGPNNVLLWASGARFGLRATARHVIGTALGIGFMALVVAAGVDTLLTTVPTIALAMKVAASAYLLYLAYQVAGARALERGELARPLGLLQAAAFQAINPKAWIFAIGAIAAFRPAGYPILEGSLLVAGTMIVVVLPTAALWAGAGGALNGMTTRPRSRRLVSLGLALLVAATVVEVWI